MMKRKVEYVVLLCLMLVCGSSVAFSKVAVGDIRPGEIWPDNRGKHINAHGGGILYHEGVYYWFGEHKSDDTCDALVGVNCYSSTDLLNWKYERVALPVEKNPKSDITRGCVLERPKVIYNAKTRKFVMWFHLELKGHGYDAARCAVAVSDKPCGPYRFIRSYRPDAGFYPQDMDEAQRKALDRLNVDDYKDTWWTDAWRDGIEQGAFLKRDLQGGQMSRDMTLFVDDDGKAYHIFSSEENLTLHIAELSDDYLSHTGKYVRVAPGGHNEAPAIFKHKGTYWMITSGCTGWAPNAARMFRASSIWGPWTPYANPCRGEDADLTFHSQSTYILPVEGVEDAFIFMADRWKPEYPSDGRYIWLPVGFYDDGTPFLEWKDQWNPTDKSNYEVRKRDYKLVWSDDFNQDGRLDTTRWAYEEGFERNHELQWYQADNAECRNGCLVITARQESRPSPIYDPSRKDWRTDRRMIECTSASVNTRGKFSFRYGRLEVKARIPVAGGAWPAIWTLGDHYPWPSNGEIDVMEYYRVQGVPHILANAAWGDERPYHAIWNSVRVPFDHFLRKDAGWADKFHVWRMDWDEEAIRLYLDDELLNVIWLSQTLNGSIGRFTNPFCQPHYILLNLAIGGDNGGDPDWAKYPLKYEIDYVKVYQKE